MLPPTPAELRAWMDRNGYSTRTLAAAIGSQHSTIWRYTQGENTPPPMLTLALRWLEAERQQERDTSRELSPSRDAKRRRTQEHTP